MPQRIVLSQAETPRPNEYRRPYSEEEFELHKAYPKREIPIP
jgi:hypothetical protein